MAGLRSRTIQLVGLLVLAGASLRPVAPLEAAVDALFLPARLMAELSGPLLWMRAQEVSAAEQALLGAAGEVRRGAEVLLEQEQSAALPREAERRAGRRLVHGEVLRRSRGRLDSVVVRLASIEGVVQGLPVVSGEHYVGRVARVLEPTGRGAPRVEVDLVTASDFFVGADVLEDSGSFGRPEPVQLVAGGLAPNPAGEEGALYLAVHNPSRKSVTAGEVVVSEHEALDEAVPELASGFRLGRLERARGSQGSELLRIRPGIDYRSGLFQVVVLAPEGSGPAEERLALATFDPRSWVGARVLAAGEVSPRREGLRVTAGRLAGLQRGAAVCLGSHLLGRVAHAGWASSDVRLLGDPGAELAALARLEGSTRPRPLGRLVSLGRRARDGALLFRWAARVPLAAEGEAGAYPARLYTGSGEPGLPRGLLVGETELPVGPGPHVLAVHQEVSARALAEVWVWRDAEEAAP